MKRSELKEKVEKGGIISNVVLEVLGHPKEHVEETLKKFIERIKADKSYVVLGDLIHPAVEQKNEFFSSFAEIELFAKDLDALFTFCFDYMPSSIDIIEPENFTYESRIFSGFLNDLAAKLHDIDKIARNSDAQSKLDRKNMVLVVRYAILRGLKDGSKSFDDLRDRTGLAKENLEQYLDALEKGGLVSKSGDNYSLTGKVVFKNEQ